MEPAWVAAGAAVVSSFAAIWAAFNGVRTLARARDDSRARSRPMVTAELRLPPYSKGTQLLVVQNHGPTLARDVEVSFDPPLGDPAPEVAHESVTPFLKRRYAAPIPVLAPGVELDNIYYSGQPGPSGKFENVEPVPDQVTVTVSYRGPDGTGYRDDFPLDIALLGARTYTTSSREPLEVARAAAKSLDGIHKVLKARG